MSAPEFQLQKAICELLTVGYPEVWFTAVPNGAALCATNDPAGRQRAKREMAKLKISGMKVGTPDLVLCWASFAPGERVNTVEHVGETGFIEVKSWVGRLSEEQKSVHAWLTAHGHRVSVVRSTDDLLAILKEWGCPTRLTT